MPSPRRLFVNLMVKDLAKSKAFFQGLGFSFNPKFEDDSGACLVISDENFIMLLTPARFAGFTPKRACDTEKENEALIALTCNSREEVDVMVKKAVASGGRHAMPPQDHGFMYGWSFYDLDGHHFEPFWFNDAAG